MKSLLLKLSKGSKPLSLKVADAIREAIVNQRITKGEKLPSTRTLANQLGVHRQTVMAGLDELVAEGWIISIPRKGYLVSDDVSPQASSNKTKKSQKLKEAYRWDFARTVNLEPFESKHSSKFNFQSGLPDLRLFPKKEFQYYLSRAWKQNRPDDLGYNSPQGLNSTIEAVDICLRRVKNVSNRTTIITNGSQEAIYIAAQLLIKQGDHVAIEDPGYPTAVATFASLGAKILPIPVDSNGIVPEALEKLVKKHRIKLLFITPHHQFPTTSTLSAPRRIRILEIANKYNFPILEDDYDHEFQYRTKPISPITSFDDEGRIIYIGTLSKVLFPSARIGFISVPKIFANNFMNYRRLTTHSNEFLLQKAISLWMLEGGFERHVYRMRKIYLNRLTEVEKKLHSLKSQGKELSWSTPAGGMAIWLNLHTDSTKVAQKALAKGVFVNPEQYYRLDGKAGTHIRLGFSNQEEDALKEGLNKLSEVLP